MKKQILEKILQKELASLNYQIDLKIIKGLSYAREARRHKFLLSNLAQLRRQSQSRSSWFGTFKLTPAKG